MRLIDADALDKVMGEAYLSLFTEYGSFDAYAMGYESAVCAVEAAPTIDAVPVDAVAQMLADAFGDYCPCNYNNIDEWLPLLCEEDSACGEHKDKLHCWKIYIKHHGERRDGNA